MTSNTYRKILIEKVRALARDLDSLAPDLVGDSDLMTNFEIQLKFPSDGLATITLIREHIGKECSTIFFKKEE